MDKHFYIYISASIFDITHTQAGVACVSHRVSCIKHVLTMCVDACRYDDVVTFLDPITKYNNAQGYMFNIRFLKKGAQRYHNSVQYTLSIPLDRATSGGGGTTCIRQHARSTVPASWQGQ